MKEIKFTKRELKLISAMRDGWEIRHTELAGNNSLSLRKGQEDRKITLWATFNSLITLGIIQDVGKHGWTTAYALTELGKTCKIINIEK